MVTLHLTLSEEQAANLAFQLKISSDYPVSALHRALYSMWTSIQPGTTVKCTNKQLLEELIKRDPFLPLTVDNPIKLGRRIAKYAPQLLQDLNFYTTKINGNVLYVFEKPAEILNAEELAQRYA